MKLFKKYRYLVLLFFAIHFLYLAGSAVEGRLLLVAVGSSFLAYAVKDYFGRCRH